MENESEPKKSLPTWAIVLIVLFGGGVLLVSTLGVIAWYGMRKFVANSKIAEARNSVGQISRDAAVHFEDAHMLCKSASSPVPVDPKSVSGKKYQSTQEEWTSDKDAGFSCLQFMMQSPQYFQYNYASTPTSTIATARGDLNGDGVFSTFELRGELNSGIFVVAPALTEITPEE